MKLDQYLGKYTDNLEYGTNSRLIDNSVFVGVEIEVEGLEYHEHRKGMPELFCRFAPHHDGSLRKGTEFVFRKPFSGSNITSSLDLWDKFVEVYSREVNPITISDRCSVHVHLNMGDLEFEEIYNFIMWYILLERVVFKSVTPQRYKNNNCRTLSDSDVIPALATFRRRPDSESQYNLSSFISLILNHCDKYSALNLLPLRNYGSLEFRHHHGTLSGADILSWINIILALRKWSLSNKLSECYLEVTHKIITDVLSGTDLISKLPPDYDMLFEQGLMDIKQIFNYDVLVQETSDLIKSCSPTTKTTLFYRYKKANNVVKETV